MITALAPQASLPKVSAVTRRDLGCAATAETCVLITMLAPSLAAFSAIQQAHRAFRITPAQMFMVRCSWRELYHESLVPSMRHVWKLPSGRFDGVCVCTHDSGAYRGYRYYVNGKPNGDRKQWDASGRLLVHCTYVDGKRHGECLRWRPIDKLNIREMYVNGKQHGEHKVWFDSGQLGAQSTYEYGNLHGESKSWWSTGHPYEQCTYVNNVMHGEYRSWLPSGSPYMQCTHVNGRKHGEYRSWLPSGHPYVQCTYANGELHGEYKEWMNGVIYLHYVYDQNVIVQEIGVQN